MSDNTYPLSTIRHSLAHLLAQSVQRTVDAKAQLGIGPAIEHGFYYDFLFRDGVGFHEDQLKSVTKNMQLIAKQGQSFQLYESNPDDARMILESLGQTYKIDLLDKFVAEGETRITFYLNTIVASAADHLLADASDEYREMYAEITSLMQSKMSGLSDEFVTFIDMCEGPHVVNTKEIPNNAFSLDKVAGAYWRGDANNIMMTRLYGFAFETKDQLKGHQEMIAEAKKRDHRVLGHKLGLFTISPLVGAGLPLMQPKGMVVRQALEDYLWELHRERGYDRVWTPHIAKQDLYETSGHWAKFGDELFKVQGKDEHFCMKPMNCPHHMQIFADNQFSYRDMPIRYFEPATVYRDEKTGQLSGLTRVRAITQDDGHLFCRVGQLQEEVGAIVEVIREFYTTMGMMNEYWVSLSIRDEEDRSKYLGADEVWEQAESALEDAAKANDLNYQTMTGEAAFYGPKLDFMFKDALGREWQLATIQVDFNLPERFDLSYINEAGEKERPVVIHRAICGSFERFMGVMIEHFAGAFPVWLAPRQVQILSVADKFNDYAHKVAADLKKHQIRVDVDDSDHSLAKKIRNAEGIRVPYMLIVGEQEVSTAGVSVREYSTKKQYDMTAKDFLKQVVSMRDERKLMG